MSRLPRAARLTITVSVLVMIVAILVYVLLPSGASTAVAAATNPVRSRADSGTVKVLVTRAWGSGELVLVGFDHGGVRMLRLTFAAHGSRGWRDAASTEQRADLNDVAVGSLIVARSDGGKGQPPWTVAAGELGDRRIHRVQIRWTDGTTTTDVRRNDAYLVVRRGLLTASAVRYVAANGAEIAKVPISGH
jgi:hypothetical protein